MDYEKLIEQLHNFEACAYGYHINGKVLGVDCSDFEQVMVDAAEEISKIPTLQAENEKLRTELKSNVDLVFRQAKELDRRHLLLQEQEAELEQVNRERDAALCRLDAVYETRRADMERYTYQDGGKWRIRIGDTEHSGQWVDRLAAYEDTGLEPEDLKRAVNEDAVLKLAGQALGITPDRLRELAQAAQKGGGQPRRSHRKVPENQGGGQHGQAENLRGAGDRSGRGI